tara:strand:+ start:220 stop:645 length:426 start_codon:yes stop_codon:yes gene_type:complete
LFKTPKILTYAGVVPFFFLTVLMLYQTQSQIVFAFLYLIYGGFIISFLAGSHWKQAVMNKDDGLQILCMMPTILAVFIIILGMVFNPVWMLPMLMVLFVWLYRLDTKLSGDVGLEYLLIRRNVTVLFCTLVIISFAVSYEF